MRYTHITVNFRNRFKDASEFEESKHPRAANGQFGSGSGRGKEDVDLSKEFAGLFGDPSGKSAGAAKEPAKPNQPGRQAPASPAAEPSSPAGASKSKATVYNPGKVTVSSAAPAHTDWDDVPSEIEHEGETYRYNVGYYTEGNEVHSVIDDIEIVSPDDDEESEPAAERLTKTQLYKLKKAITKEQQPYLDDRAKEESDEAEWDAMSEEEQHAAAKEQESAAEREDKEHTRMVHSLVDKALASGWRPTINAKGNWGRSQPQELQELASPRSQGKIKARLLEKGISLDPPKAQGGIASNLSS